MENMVRCQKIRDEPIEIRNVYKGKNRIIKNGKTISRRIK
jgi:hypothetical protein